MRHRYFLPLVLLAGLTGGCRSASEQSGAGPANSVATKAVTPRANATVAAPATKSDGLFARVLPFKIANHNEPLETQLSPDGRYIACFGAPENKRQRFVVYDLVTLKSSRFDVGGEGGDSLIGGFFVWRQDSRACAVAASSGIAVVTLDDKKVRWATRTALTFAACLSWSPVTQQLAIFEGNYISRSYFHLWDGQKIVRRPDWNERDGDVRTSTERAAMQVEWSPDEKFIALRYEGRSGISGTFTNPMGLMVLDAKTGRACWWHDKQAGPVQWLDKSRLIFQEFDDFASPGALVVATPRNGKSSSWRSSVDSWAFDHKNAKIWALAGAGKAHNLYRTSAQKPQWTLERRDVQKITSDDSPGWKAKTAFPDLFFSPSGDVVALSNKAAAVAFVDTTTGQIRRWKSSAAAVHKGDFQFLGWPKNQRFPLVAYQPSVTDSSDARWQLWQLEAPQ